jgi:hypothetical protein
MRVLDRLDTPAQVISDLGQTLVQNPLAVALLGDKTGYTGLARSSVYRWFTDPDERLVYPEEDRDRHARLYVGDLRAAAARDDSDRAAAELIEALTRESPEFVALWEEHEVLVRTSDRKRMVHPRIGTIELDCQILVAEYEAQRLLVYTATPGTEDHDKLRLLSVIGAQEFGDGVEAER